MEMYGMTGEPLGTIGQIESGGQPQWQKDLLSKPSISIRKGYASNYDDPYEDSSVLVLTARSGKFIDIRFPADARTDSSKAQQPLSSYKNFWAFSGLSTTTFYSPTSKDNSREDAIPMPYTAHTVFEHEIDTKGPGITDEGDMFLLPNGDCMEVGVWTNPLTGKYEMYKEYWTSPEATDTAGIGGSASDMVLKKKPCIVAETVKSDTGRGIMIRIGDYFQSLYDKNTTSTTDKIVVARKERSSDSARKTDEMGWVLDPRSSREHDMIPSNWLLDLEKSVKLGDSMVADGVEWRITEAEY